MKKREHTEASRLEFEQIVKRELGDIAVSDDSGRYISHKIQNYWRTWQESESYHVPRADTELAAYALTVENLTAERDALLALRAIEDGPDPLTIAYMHGYRKGAERANALEADAGRYRWLSEYFISDDTKHYDSIVDSRTVAQLSYLIDEIIKGAETCESCYVGLLLCGTCVLH